MEILLINGPNLNLLGNRENSIYGNDTLEDIEKISEICKENGVSFASFQSNAEHEIVEKIHASKEDNVSKILSIQVHLHIQVFQYEMLLLA